MNKDKEVAKKSPLGGAVEKFESTDHATGERIIVDVGPAVDYSAEKVKFDLEKFGVAPVTEVEITDPISGKKSMITIDRTGTNEARLQIALADKNLNRDQKDAVLSMYLFERGKDSASFLVDLMRYKGSHTKETRAFRSQVRFDFEMFVSMFSKCLDDSAFGIGDELGYTGEQLRELGNKYVVFLKDQAEHKTGVKSVGAFAKSIKLKMSPERAALLRIAFQDLASADVLKTSVSNTAAARERDNGKGIYISGNNKVFSVDDPEITEIIAKDKERLEELNKQDNGQI